MVFWLRGSPQREGYNSPPCREVVPIRKANPFPMNPPTEGHLATEQERQDRLAEAKRHTHGRYGMRRMLAGHARHMLAPLPPGSDLIEVGCGIGDFLEHVLHHSDHRALGIDLSSEAVRVARERFRSDQDRIQAVAGPAEGLQEAVAQHGGDFRRDAVLMRGVIHHLESPEQVFREVHDVLRPGGRLVILEGNVDSLYRRMVLGLADRLGIPHEASQFAHTPPGDIQRLLARLGFDDVRLSYVPGLFAPLAYVGKGGPLVWKVADSLNALAGKVTPRLVGWWYLMVATRAA